MNKTIEQTLRWIAVLPLSIASAIAATFVLHFILYSTLTKFVTPYPEFAERALTPFVIAIIFVWTGSKIAPNNKLKVGVILFSIWILLAYGFIILVLTGGKWFGNDLNFEANGIAPIMAIIGAFVGLYWARKKNRENQNISNDLSFYNEFKDEIFIILFAALYTICIFNTTGRYIIFIFFILLGLIFSFYSIKEKLYTTKKMKMNLTRDILMTIALIIGLLGKEVGLYVSVICLAWCIIEFIRGIIIEHLIGRSKPALTNTFEK